MFKVEYKVFADDVVFVISDGSISAEVKVDTESIYFSTIPIKTTTNLVEEIFNLIGSKGIKAFIQMSSNIQDIVEGYLKSNLPEAFIKQVKGLCSVQHIEVCVYYNDIINKVILPFLNSNAMEFKALKFTDIKPLSYIGFGEVTWFDKNKSTSEVLDECIKVVKNPKGEFVAVKSYLPAPTMQNILEFLLTQKPIKVCQSFDYIQFSTDFMLVKVLGLFVLFSMSNYGEKFTQAIPLTKRQAEGLINLWLYNIDTQTYYFTAENDNTTYKDEQALFVSKRVNELTKEITSKCRKPGIAIILPTATIEEA